MKQKQNTERRLPAWLKENKEALRAFTVLAPKGGPDELIAALGAVGVAYEIYRRKSSAQARSAPVDIDFEHYKLADPDVPILEDSFDDHIGCVRHTRLQVCERVGSEQMAHQRKVDARLVSLG